MVVRARCAQSDGSALAWAFDQFGSVLTHACGTGACLPEADYLLEEIQSAACSGSFTHKVTLVLDGGNINDGTFNQLAYEGGVAACTAAASCCLEVDRVDDDVEDAETRFFCELEYAAQDSDMVVGVGFLVRDAISIRRPLSRLLPLVRRRRRRCSDPSLAD